MNQICRPSVFGVACGFVLALAITCPLVSHSQNRDPDRVAVLGSTVPANGDVNPYGVARVPRSVGNLVEGRFLVSNFNNAANQQGTGTTIVQMQANGSMRLFAQVDPSKISCPGGVGLTTALVVLQSGYVIVGSLPTADGTAATARAGCRLSCVACFRTGTCLPMSQQMKYIWQLRFRNDSTRANTD